MQLPDNSWRAVFIRELRRMKRRKLYLLMTIILPLLSFLFFIILFSNDKPENLNVAIIDHDHSSLSAKLLKQVNMSPMIHISDYPADMVEAKKLMQKGKCYAVLIIPKDFMRDVYRNSQAEVIHYYNNAYMVAGGQINAEITNIVSQFSAGIDYQQRIKKGENPKQALASINPISIDTHKLFNPYLNYFYYLATAFMPIMLLIFILMSTVYAIGCEYKQSTAKVWLRTANGSITKALTGKLLPYSIIWLVYMLFLNVIMFSYLKLPLEGSVYLLALNSFLFVAAYVAVGIVIIAIFPNLRMGLSVASIYSAMAFTFSGLTYPYIAMYDVFAWVGNFFPFSHYLNVFFGQSIRAAEFGISFKSLFYLNLFLLLPFPFLPKLKKMCLNTKYWGKL